MDDFIFGSIKLTSHNLWGTRVKNSGISLTGTAADIIEFFDSFKDEKVASEKVLVLLTLAIWSWSLMQFTVVLTATKSRKSRGAANRSDMYVRTHAGTLRHATPTDTAMLGLMACLPTDYAMMGL